MADFYNGLQGGSILEVHALVMVPLFALLYSGNNEFVKCWIVFLLAITVVPSEFTILFLCVGFVLWYSLPWRSDFSLPYPSITNFKALMMTMTIICILAVDFPIFNRRYAKTEEYGTSLMDIGVGTFIYSGGLMYGLRKGNTLKGVVKKAFPVWLVGIIRLLSIKLLNYHEQVTEYGEHWNFFITLGIIPVLATLVDKIPIYNDNLAYVLGALYQLSLNNGLMAFIIDSERNNIFTQNREGILSCIGYLALWLLASDLAPYLNKENFTSKILKRVVLHSFLFFASFSKVSRRATNFPFILWCCIISDVFLWFLHVKKVGVPNLLKLINKNQLPLFLVANVVTGVINMTIDTRNASPVLALLILVNYCLFITTLAYFL